MQFFQSVLLAAFLLFVPVLSSTTQAAELVMFEQDGCVWCQKWHAEIGPGYPNTQEARRAPLRLVDINKPIPDDLENIRVERFTPTFVLVEEGKELGRIRGYPGDEFFWFLLGEILDKAGIAPDQG